MEADRPDDLVAVDDRGLEPIVLDDLPTGTTDELETGVRGIARRLDPWEPFGEMRAIRRDDANELLRIGLLEEPKEAALRKLVSEHRRSLTIRACGRGRR